MHQYTYDDIMQRWAIAQRSYNTTTTTTSGTLYTTTPIYEYITNQWSPCYVSEIVSESEKMPEEFNSTQLAEIDLFE